MNYYRNNAISGRENKDISTGNNTRALSLNSFFDGLNVSEVPQPKAPVCLLLRQTPSCWGQQQRSITTLPSSKLCISQEVIIIIIIIIKIKETETNR